MKYLPLVLTAIFDIALTGCNKDYTEECDSFCSKIETCGIPIAMENCTTNCNTDMSEKADPSCQLAFEALHSCFENNTCEEILDEEKNPCGVETTAWLTSCMDFMTSTAPAED